MRLLGRLVVLLLLLPPAAWLAYGAAQATQAWLASQRGTEPPPEADVDVSIVYALDRERWTSFPFAAAQEVVRLVTHADVPAASLGEPDARWRYGIAIRLLGSGGAVLKEGVHHYATRVIAYRDPATGALRPGASYPGDGLVPTTGDVTVLDLGELPGAMVLQARLAEAEPPVRRVNLRVYEREPVAERRVAALWERMGGAARRRLASATLFPPELLSPEERANLVRNRWHPVGPSGIQGQDYAALELHALDEPPGQRVEPPPLPLGLYVDGDHHGTVPTGPNPGRLRLDFQPLALGEKPPSAAEAPIRVTLHRHGERRGESASQEITLAPPAPMSHRMELGPGLLEIVSSAPVMVRAWLEGGEGEDAGPDATAAPREITPEPARLRVFLADEGGGVVYPIRHVGDEPTPLRLDVRCLCPRPDAAGGDRPVLRYELLDADGTTVGQGTLEPVLAPSPYDRVAVGPEPGLVSDPASAYLNLPAGVAAVRLRAGAPLLVAAYTRPPDVARLVLVPENREETEDEIETRTWFYLRPDGWEALQAAQRSVLLVVQARPPEPPEAEILQGLYELEQFVPQGPWLARELIVPRGELPLRMQALDVTYTPTPVGRQVELEFVGEARCRLVEPQLLFLRPRRGPMELAVQIDGRQHFRETVTAARGELRLPPLPPGSHEVRVSTSGPVDVLIDRVRPSGEARIKRRALRLAPGVTTFAIEKRTPGPELLTAHLFPVPGAAGRRDLTVTVEGGEDRALGPFEDWTVRRHRFSLRSGPEPADVPVLGADERVGPERAVFIPLGSDLPPGTYDLTFRLGQGPETYVSLTRTTPGLAGSREIRGRRDQEEGRVC